MQNGRAKSKYSDWSAGDLTDFRTRMGVSRQEMASKLGVSYRMYCYYESGHTKIDLSLEYAVRWLGRKSDDELVSEAITIAGIADVTPPPQGTLTAFQKERISRLLNAIHNYPTSDLDEKGQKILSQCVDEISLLTSHLSES